MFLIKSCSYNTSRFFILKPLGTPVIQSPTCYELQTYFGGIWKVCWKNRGSSFWWDCCPSSQVYSWTFINFKFWFQLSILPSRCLSYINQQKYLEAYTEQSALVQAFTKLFQTQKEDNWALFIMYVISLDLRMFAIKADKELAKKGADKPGQTLEKAAECLMGLFRVCAADK